MGQFEKIVVLIAFFLVTVILVVTFNAPPEDSLSFTMEDSEVQEGAEVLAEGDEDIYRGEAESLNESEGRAPSRDVEFPAETEDLFARDLPGPGSNPRRSTRDNSGEATAAGLGDPSLREMSLQELSLQEKKSRADLMLDDSFEARAPQGMQLPKGAALITLEGLTSTFDTDLMEYTWRRNDTWVDVAERLYGDQSKSALLRQFNEGSGYHAPGERILVPVFDLRDEAVVSSNGATPREESQDEELSEERGNLYRVVDGDSLWVISKKVYGKGAQWEKIYKANQDLLSSPDDVKPGMGLRIP